MVAAPAIAAVWSLIVPEYTATAKVRVRPFIKHLVFRSEDDGRVPLYESFLNTQVSVILSPSVLRRVLDDPDVRKTEWFGGRDTVLPRRKFTPMERLAEALSVRPLPKTEVIDVAMTATDADDAAVIVNCLLNEYLRFAEEMTDPTDDRAYHDLTDSYTSAAREIEGRKRIVTQLQRDLGTGTPEKLVSQRRVRLDDMEAQLARLRRKLATAEWQEKRLVAEVEKSAGEPAGTPPACKPRYEDDDEWRHLNRAVKSIQSELDLNGRRYGEAHPKMIELAEQVRLAKEALQERERLLDRLWEGKPHPGSPVGRGRKSPQQALRALRREINLLRYEAQLVQEDVQQERAEFKKTFDKAEALAREVNGIERTKEVYETVRERLDRKEAERLVPGSIEVLARAFAPSEPSRDLRLLFSAWAVVGGLAIGVGLAFLRSKLSRSFYGVREMLPSIPTPFLGQVPLVHDVQNPTPEERQLQDESIRMVRTALLHRLDSHQGTSILVASAGPGAGKTTIAILLAKSLGQSGKKVLLVDAHLRSPAIAQRFDIDPQPGLVEALTCRADDREAIVATSSPRLSLLPAGSRAGNADSELLADGAFSACLERWRRRFDIVLLDCPSILSVADTRIIARQTDGAVIVIREGYCRRSDVIDSLNHLVDAGTKLYGTVFIGARRRGHRTSPYYGSGYPSSSRSPLGVEAATIQGGVS